MKSILKSHEIPWNHHFPRYLFSCFTSQGQLDPLEIKADVLQPDDQVPVKSSRGGEEMDWEMGKSMGNIGNLMGFHSDFMGFHGDFMGFHSDFMGFHGDFMGFNSDFMGFHGDFMGFHSDFMGFHGDFMGFSGI